MARSLYSAFSRRSLLKLGTGTIMALGLPLLAACAGPPPEVPTTTAPAPTTAPASSGVPTAAVAPAATAAPGAATATPAATTSSAAPTSTIAAQTAATTTPSAPIKTVQIVDTIPTTFHEAPQLADLVKAGKLPPVEQRLPSAPLVYQPIDQIGKYGGTWRSVYTGPGDDQNMERIMHDHFIYWDPGISKVVPNIAKNWDIQDGGRTFVFHLRPGMKWSDGQPFGADDIMFWYEDLYSNKDLTPTPAPEFSINGKPGKFVKIDDLTVQAQFPEPYPMFIDVLAGFTTVGSGLALGGGGGGGGGGNVQGPYAPAHYLKQFHQKYAAAADLDRAVKAAGLDNWVSLIKNMNDYQINVDCPVLTPWRTISPNNTPNWLLERNPYYGVVDTDGNQLPYLDKWSLNLAESLEVANLRAIAGELDEQTRHLDLQKLPVFLENRDKGNYTVRLDPQAESAQTSLQFNLSYTADPEIAKWLNNKDFRRALSMGIDRAQINEAFFLGTGTPGSVAPSDDAPDSPGPEWRNKWSTLDVAQANSLLDKIGLDKKDSDGYRVRTDNGDRLRIEITTVAAAFLPWAQQMEMVAEHWKKDRKS